MILQRLVEYYDRLAVDPQSGVAAPGFSREKIGFALVIDPNGDNPVLQDLREGEGKRLGPRMMSVPSRGGRQGTGLKPNFLWDNTGYVLGRDSKGKPERALQMFQSFREFHEQMLAAIDDDGLRAVVAFLKRWNPADADKLERFDEAIDKNLIFRVAKQQRFVHESQAVTSGWRAPVEADDAPSVGQSLLSGDIGPIARLHPLISGVRGAQTMGAALASFNLDAFTSYGLQQTYNAPVGVADAFKYTTALNRLLEDRQRTVFLGDATVVFWSERPTPLEDAAAALFGEMPVAASGADMPPEDRDRVQRVRLFLTQLRDGSANSSAGAPDASDGDTQFFVLGLSPNASRLSVRFWYDGTVREMSARLRRHLADCALDGTRDDDAPLTVRRIVQSTGRAIVRDGKFKGYDADAVSPLLGGAVARSVLTDGPYPQMLLGALLNRLRADGATRHERFAAIKACLVRNSRLSNSPKEVSVSLDSDRNDPPYLIGRLFALLEKVQSDSANGTINATIKDRYFSAASSTPGLVFPRLLRLAQHHLAKLDDRLKVFYDRQIGEVVGKLDRFASHMNLEEQGLFAIGYYHQRQSLYTKKVAKEGDANP
jgi:CRISPR-associated protein Csd1